MNNTTTLTGILTDVFPVENFSNFSKRMFWVKQPDTEQYPEHWQLELHTRDIDRLKGFQIGDVIECEVAIRGKKFTKRGGGGESIFNTLQCIGVKVIQAIGKPAGFVAKPQPGREPDSKRQDPQGKINW